MNELFYRYQIKATKLDLLVTNHTANEGGKLYIYYIKFFLFTFFRHIIMMQLTNHEIYLISPQLEVKYFV